MSQTTRLISRPKLEGWPLTAIAILLGSTLILAGWSSHEKRAQSQAQAEIRQAQLPAADALGRMSRQLVFSDAPDTSIAVTDARTGRSLASIEGEAGFARSVLRSLAKSRIKLGLGPEQPFELVRTAQGGLLLRDPQTGQQVDLTALGPTNAGVFAVYLKSI
jgi:putative photosynthetic complex assembly protein